MKLIARLRDWARRIKRDALTLWYCARHPDTPLLPKLLTLLLAAYAFSPIDLIPDFIPVLGLLDELILLPLGIAFCIKLIPATVVEECRAAAAQSMAQSNPRSYAAAAVIVLLWLGALWLLWAWLT